MSRISVLYLALLFVSTSGIRQNEEKTMGITQLLLWPSYDPQMAPQVSDENTDVYVNFQLLHILHLDEFRETIRISGMFYLKWNDSRLQWRLETNSSSFLRYPMGSIWTPKLRISNSIRSEENGSFRTGIIIVGDHEGKLEMSVPILVTTVCPLDLTKFPNDQQKCALNVRSSSNLILKDTFQKQNELIDKNQWRLTNYSETVTTNNQFSIQLSLKRRYMNYGFSLVTQLIVAAICLLLLIFLLPPASGERILMGCTAGVILFGVLLYLYRNLAPSRDAVPVLAFVTSKLTVQVTFASILSAIGINQATGIYRKPPYRLIRWISFSRLASFVLVQRMKKRDISGLDRDTESKIYLQEWVTILTVLDRINFIFLVISFAFLLIYLVAFPVS